METDPNPHGAPKEGLKGFIWQFQFKPGLSTALFTASGALCKQRTWREGDYAEHWLMVADVNSGYVTVEEKIVGILHDVVEDSDWTLTDFLDVKFNQKIVDAVDSVTKREDELYLDGIRRCSHNEIGRHVKLRDNLHNLDLTRNAAEEPSDKQKYLYLVSYHYLDAVEKGSVTPGASVWEVLRNPGHRGALYAESFPHIAAATSDAVSEDIAKRFSAAPVPLPVQQRQRAASSPGKRRVSGITSRNSSPTKADRCVAAGP